MAAGWYDMELLYGLTAQMSVSLGCSTVSVWVGRNPVIREFEIHELQPVNSMLIAFVSVPS